MLHFCYLCFDTIDVARAVSSLPQGTKLLRHPKCYKALPAQAKTVRVQEQLRHDAEPSFQVALDELELRAAEHFRSLFVQFFRPCRITNPSLPPELLVIIADNLFRSDFSRRLLLDDFVARAIGFLRHKGSLQTERLSGVCFIAGSASRTRMRTIRNTRYVVDIAGSDKVPEQDAISSMLEPPRPWSHLVFTLDVSGCLAAAPYHGEPVQPRPGKWYRVLSKADVHCHEDVPAKLISRYQGRTLRDVFPEAQEGAALFDKVPPPHPVDTAWYYESIVGNTFTHVSPRMRTHPLPSNVSAISMAFLDRAMVDIHFHTKGDPGLEVFRHRLRRSPHQILLRHARLDTDDRLVEVAVRTDRLSLGTSSACLMFRTAAGRVVDLGPAVESEVYVTPLLTGPAELRAIYLNHRGAIYLPAVVAVATAHPPVPSSTLWSASSVRIIPFPERHAALFTDQVRLESDLAVQLSVDEEGLEIVQCILSSTPTDEPWIDESIARLTQPFRTVVIQHKDLDQWCLINLKLKTRSEVQLLRQRRQVDCHSDRGTLHLCRGSSLTLWTGPWGHRARIDHWPDLF